MDAKTIVAVVLVAFIIGDLSLENIVNNYKGYGLPCFETIRRSRQRVQSLFPELSRQCSGCDSSIRVVIEIE